MTMAGTNLFIFLTFLALTISTLARPGRRAAVLDRSRKETALDAVGLFNQGVMIPLLQIGVSAVVWSLILPRRFGNAVDLSPLSAFALSFIVVDYLYYWNHRALHGRVGWPWHRVHHSTRELDLFATSRNSFWTPVLIVYLWSNGLAWFLLKDPVPFAAGMALTAALDLWRHSSLGFRADSPWHRGVAMLFITPHEHRWHHSSAAPPCNFGANFSLWDRWHGTLYAPSTEPPRLGVELPFTLARALFFPYAAGKA